MGRYLITGRGGSGKSTLYDLLGARGYNTYDADRIHGLARAENAQGKPVQVDWSKFVDYSQIAWNWRASVLKWFLGEQPNVFLCGSASNQLTFHSLFDKVFALSLSRKEHDQRLRARDNEYGKDPAMRAYLLEDQVVFAYEAVSRGAIAIDASGTPDETLDNILRHINDLPAMFRTSF